MCTQIRLNDCVTLLTGCCLPLRAATEIRGKLRIERKNGLTKQLQKQRELLEAQENKNRALHDDLEAQRSEAAAIKAATKVEAEGIGQRAAKKSKAIKARPKRAKAKAEKDDKDVHQVSASVD